MTVWERIEVLTQERPDVLFENWGKHLDGASLVTAVLKIGGREVACYGHDFTQRAGSMDEDDKADEKKAEDDKADEKKAEPKPKTTKPQGTKPVPVYKPKPGPKPPAPSVGDVDF